MRKAELEQRVKQLEADNARFAELAEAREELLATTRAGLREIEAEMSKLELLAKNAEAVAHEVAPLIRQGELLKERGFHVWVAENSEPVADFCIGWGGDEHELGLNFYPAHGTPKGVVVTDGTKTVGAYGLVPAEVMISEIEYTREHG